MNLPPDESLEKTVAGIFQLDQPLVAKLKEIPQIGREIEKVSDSFSSDRLISLSRRSGVSSALVHC